MIWESCYASKSSPIKLLPDIYPIINIGYGTLQTVVKWT